MAREQVSEPTTAADDEYAAVPTTVIEFGDDVKDGFVGLVEHTLPPSECVRTDRVDYTGRGNNASGHRGGLPQRIGVSPLEE
jgi:hypothetical protein